MALMKAATQSETLWNYDPNLAVDGDSNTCSFTPQSDVQRWWQVSLSISVNTVVEFHSEAGEIQCIFAP